MNSFQPGSMLAPLTHLGRFPSLRRVYSFLMGFRERPTLKFHRNNIEFAGASIAKSRSTCFDLELIGQCFKDLKARGISQRLRLPDPVVDELVNYARAMPFRDLDGRSTFMMADLENGLSSSDAVRLRGICSDVSSSRQIMEILSDYVLCQIAARYLGFEPSTVEAYLEVLVAPRTEEANGGYNPFDYHYDVPGLNFMASFST